MLTTAGGLLMAGYHLDSNTSEALLQQSSIGFIMPSGDFRC
jgi:hypothetical protein